MENILIRGLTEEEKERLHEMQLKRAVEEGKKDSVNRLVAEGILDAERACEIIGIPYETYLSDSSGE